MQRALEIDAGNGETFTIESSLDGVRSLFPAALAHHSHLHESEGDAWLWIHGVRARQVAEEYRSEREFELRIDTMMRRTFRVRAKSFVDASAKWATGEAELVSQTHTDPGDPQVIDPKSGQWAFFRVDEDAAQDSDGAVEDGRADMTKGVIKAPECRR
ncbi:hypothetical protein [Aureimonas sp. AU12]|uniref:hypothetical protein n=1 Tax=Aureimonas sp. AU12 TaxID=1638161 RepID=UPI000780ADED|nr:hypothetical protein [Aureimonas sp. AU12]